MFSAIGCFVTVSVNGVTYAAAVYKITALIIIIIITFARGNKSRHRGSMCKIL